MYTKEDLLNTLDILAAPHICFVTKILSDMRSARFSDPKTLSNEYYMSVRAIKLYRDTSRAIQELE